MLIDLLLCSPCCLPSVLHSLPACSLMHRSVQSTALAPAVASTVFKIKWNPSNVTSDTLQICLLLALYLSPFCRFSTYTVFLCFEPDHKVMFSPSWPLYIMCFGLEHYLFVWLAPISFSPLFLQKLFLNPKSVQGAPTKYSTTQHMSQFTWISLGVHLKFLLLWTEVSFTLNTVLIWVINYSLPSLRTL